MRQQAGASWPASTSSSNTAVAGGRSPAHRPGREVKVRWARLKRPCASAPEAGGLDEQMGPSPGVSGWAASGGAVAAGLRGPGCTPERGGERLTGRASLQPGPGAQGRVCRLSVSCRTSSSATTREHEQQRQGLITSRAACLGGGRVPWSQSRWQQRLQQLASEAGDDAGAARLARAPDRAQDPSQPSGAGEEVSSRRRREVLGRWGCPRQQPRHRRIPTCAACWP